MNGKFDYLDLKSAESTKKIFVDINSACHAIETDGVNCCPMRESER